MMLKSRRKKKMTYSFSRFLYQMVSMAIISAGLGHLLPWWCMAFAPFVIAFLLGVNSFTSFLEGFFAIVIVWAIYAYAINIRTSSVLNEKIATIMQLSNVMLLIAITVGIGGIVGGFSALNGYYFRQIFED